MMHGQFTGVPAPARRGDVQTVRGADQLRQALLTLQTWNRALKTRNPRSWAEYQPHVVKALIGDYLECTRLWRGAVEGAELVYVRRPERLLISETSRGTVTYTPNPPGGPPGQSREATDGSDTEFQVVTPLYLVGDVIIATASRYRYPPVGDSRIDDQRRTMVDSNVDGRAWAAVDSL